MLSKTEEEVELLTELGLTPLQAKVYLTLSKMRKATLKSLSEAARIDRANVYRVVCRLQELALIEKRLTKPSTFQAVPLNQGISMLLEGKQREYLDLATASKRVLERSQNYSENPQLDAESQFFIIPSGKACARKLYEAFAHTETTNEAIIFFSDLEPLNFFVNIWKRLLSKNVRIRQIIYLQPHEILPPAVLELTKNRNFQVKRISQPPKYTLSMYDSKEAFITTVSAHNPAPNLWIKNASLIQLFYSYFESVWRSRQVHNF